MLQKGGVFFSTRSSFFRCSSVDRKTRRNFFLIALDQVFFNFVIFRSPSGGKLFNYRQSFFPTTLPLDFFSEHLSCALLCCVELDPLFASLIHICG